MSKIAETVQGFLNSMKWHWEEIEPNRYRVIIPGRTAQWMWIANWAEDESFFSSHSYSPVNVPARYRPAAAEYLTRANWNLRLGNFEMDYADGQVCFKTSMIMNGVQPTVDLINDLSIANFSIMDQYLPGLLSVIYGKVRPMAAIREVEKPKQVQEGEDENEDDEPDTDRSRRILPAKRRGDNSVAQLTQQEQKELRSHALIPVGRRGRIVQITKFLKLMGTRALETAKDSCYARISQADKSSVQETNTERYVQFCFQEKWFAIDIPNTCLLSTEAQRVVRERRGFYREAERADTGVTNDVSDLVQYDPIGKKYIYGDEKEAAEDAAYLLFDVFDLPVDSELNVTASTFTGKTSWENDQPLE